jgi:hypothetical protein
VQNNRGLGDYWVNEKVTINGVPKAAVRILGRSPHSQMKRAKGIPQYIRSVYSKFTCVICPTKSDIEIDHKDGSKVPISMLTLEDFDPKCGHCNKCKSRQCERCMATGLRYDARNMRRSFGWWVGNERFDPYGLRCMGCILYDVILFNYMESIRRRIDKSDSDYKILIDFVQKRYMRPLKDQTDYVFLPEFISLHKLRGIEEFMKSYVNASHIVKPCDEIVLPEKKEIISQTAELVSLPVIIPSIPNAVLDLFT